MKRLSYTLFIYYGWLFAISGLMVIALFGMGCRSWPEDTGDNTPAETQGSYVGNANLGGGSGNILLTVGGPDSLESLRGTIRYRSVVSEFEEIFRVTDSDSLWFSYRRDNVTYRAWASISHTGMTVSFLDPSGIPAFRVNREIDGYNMSGTWNGRISSTYWQLQNDAAMTMEQEGQSFIGVLETSFRQFVRFEINNGVVNEGSFHLNAEMFSGTSRNTAILYGSYLTRDTTTGFWETGNDGVTDNGQFILYRSFD